MSDDSYTPTPSPFPSPPRLLPLRLAFSIGEISSAMAENQLRNARSIVAYTEPLPRKIKKPEKKKHVRKKRGGKNWGGKKREKKNHDEEEEEEEEKEPDDPDWDHDEFLRVLPRPIDHMMHSTKTMLIAYDHAIRVKIRAGELNVLVIHVVDFYFTLAIDKIFSTFKPEARALYSTLNSGPGPKIVIYLSVTPEFAHMWNCSALQAWLKWRDEERAAGRDFYVRYKVSVRNQELDKNQLENLRQFLHFFDPWGNMTGDMGGIMVEMKSWFSSEYTRRGF